MNELFRYRKDDRTRAYAIRPVGEDSSELWVSAAARGRVTSSRRLVTFGKTDDVAQFLESIEQELRAGGWTRGG